MSYNDLSDLYKSFIDDVKKVVSNELDKTMKDEFKKQAEKIYDVYTPIHDNTSRYRDGIAGSYADEVNIVSTNKESTNSIEYSIYDTRKSDCDCASCSKEEIFLDNLIENGIAGHTKITERPTSEWVAESVEDNDLINKTLTDAMKNKGWETE